MTEKPSRVALCVSGIFTPDSNAVAAACALILPQESVDVFAFFWTAPAVGHDDVRGWLASQVPANASLKTWSHEPMRHAAHWDKWAAQVPKHPPELFQSMERTYYALQFASQLKAEYERQEAFTYDAVVHVDSGIKLEHAPRLSTFRSILSDHVVLGRTDLMPIFPTYDFKLAYASSRNMEICSAIHTLHLRLYMLRGRTLDIEKGFVDHFHHARLMTLSIPAQYSSLIAADAQQTPPTLSQQGV